MTLLLVDLSNNNGRVDLRMLRRYGAAGCYLKVTEGTTFADRTYTSTRAEALAAGLRVGGYHFCRPGPGSAVAEARFFLSRLGRVGRRDLRPVVDLELPGELGKPGGLEAYARLLVNTIWRESGVCPLLYSYSSFLAGMRLTTTIGCGLWLASYSRDDGKEHPAAAPAPWSSFVAHQFTSNGRVPGVSGRVDLSSASSWRPLLAHPVRGLL